MPLDPLDDVPPASGTPTDNLADGGKGAVTSADPRTVALPGRSARDDDCPLQIGPYRIESEIGRGGMGTVLRAVDPEFGRTLAVKVLQRKHQGDADLERRFLEEAHITGQLQHPGVPPVHAVGKLEDGRPYFSMKLVKGQTLAALLGEAPMVPASGGPQASAAPQSDLPRLLGIFAQVCQTLAYAHSRGIIHRDLKPSNVMVGAFGEVQVMDWGLAKVLGSETACPAEADASTVYRSPRQGLSDSSTQAGSVLGTPAFMAPEQARGLVKMVDERSDVFGLGGLLCTILTKKPPYETGSWEEVQRYAAEGDVGAAIERLRGCGADLELIDLAVRCLSPRRDDRPRHAGEVAAALAAYQAGVDERLRRAELERAAAQVQAKEERKRRKLNAALAAALVGLLTLAAGGAWWLQRLGADRRAERARVDAEQRRNIEAGLQQLGDPLQKARWSEARAILTQARSQLGDHGPDDLRQLLDQADADLNLALTLDAIRLDKSVIVDGRYDHAAAARRYAEAFARAGFGVGREDPAKAAARVASSAIKGHLVAGLDDWASIAAEDARLGWVLALVRHADADATWKDRFRDLAAWNDRAALQSLAERADAARLSPSILTVLAQRLARTGGDPLPLLAAAQAQHAGDFWLAFDLANALRDSGRPLEAEGLYRVALALRPGTPAVYTNLGYSLRDRGRLDEAINAFEKAVALDARYVLALSYLSMTLRERGRTAEAIAVSERAIGIDASFARLHYDLGLALGELGRLDEAIAACVRARALDPAFHQSLPNLGFSLQKKGRLDDAILAWEKAVALDPDDARTLGNLGLGHYLKNMPDDAIRYWRKTVAVNPNDAATWYSLGGVLTERGRPEEGAAACHKAIAIDPKLPRAHANLAAALLAQGLPDEAIPACETAIALDPADARSLGSLGVALGSVGRVHEAVVACERALALDPQQARTFSALGAALGALGRFDEALDACDKAVALAPRLASAHFNRGNALKGRGQFAEAIKALELGRELAPKNPATRLRVEQWLKETGRLRDLDARLSDILKARGKATDASEALGLVEVCRLKKLYHAAVRFYAEAAAARPEIALTRAHRYNAACHAALTAAGKGSDAAGLDQVQRSQLRRQALEWLQADLKLLSERSEKIEGMLVAAPRLRHWLKDPDLAAVRDAAALETLADEEEAAWRAFWRQVARQNKELLGRFKETRMEGLLTTKATRQVHAQTLSAGKTYVFDMESKAFDAFLRLEDAEGKLLAENDDVAPENLNARVVFTPTATGAYRLVATSYQERGLGAYVLAVYEFDAR